MSAPTLLVTLRAFALRFVLPARLEAESVDGLVRALARSAHDDDDDDDDDGDDGDDGDDREDGEDGVDLAALSAALRLAERLARRAGAVDTCLFRALARFAVLREAGVDARFVLGVRSAQGTPRAGDAEHGRDGDIDAHAWVEVDGAPFLDDGAQRAGFTRVRLEPARDEHAA